MSCAEMTSKVGVAHKISRALTILSPPPTINPGSAPDCIIVIIIRIYYLSTTSKNESKNIRKSETTLLCTSISTEELPILYLTIKFSGQSIKLM